MRCVYVCCISGDVSGEVGGDRVMFVAVVITTEESKGTHPHTRKFG